MHVRKSFTYENGLLQGVYNEYYHSGKKKEEGTFNYDQREGKWLTFHEGGELATIGRYFRDQKSGLWKYFSAAGTLRSEGRYKNDLRDGQWIYYFEDGTWSVSFGSIPSQVINLLYYLVRLPEWQLC